MLHALLTLFFVVLPLTLLETFELELRGHWLVYGPTMLVAVLIVFPMIRWLGAAQREHHAQPWSFVALAGSLALAAAPLPLGSLLVAVTVFFVAFNLLEATMPTLVSQFAGEVGRGRKMGLYTSFQFLGAFVGGLVGGASVQALGNTFTLVAAALFTLLWAGVAGPLVRRRERRIPSS